MIEVLTELGRRMVRGGKGEAARIVARDMLAPEALRAWLGRYQGWPVAVARDVLVIMAGNIPFVGMHDLVCVLAAGHRAVVKPSSRDRENMEWVVEQLLDIDPRVPVSIAGGECAPDAVIAMGSDETVEAIAARYPGVPTLLRGSRSSLAVLTGRETPGELEGVADDVLLYSGLGCRSVSLVWVPRGYDFGPLGEVLGRRVGTLPELWRGGLRQARALMRMTATPHIDTGAALLVENHPVRFASKSAAETCSALLARPSLRENGLRPHPREGNQGAAHFPSRVGVVNYAFYDDVAEVAGWIAEHDDEIQCVATNFQFPRAVRLGRTQRPGLGDYPDGRDTMRFLMEI